MDRTACPRCADTLLDNQDYACLFGQYLGDGHITTSKRKVHCLSIFCADPFLRGLIHSDGCRMTNWARRPVAGKMKRCEYPRYFFDNKSLDILALCCAALHCLGIAYRRPRWDQVSVARREAVAALDVWVGPKT